MRAVCSGTDGIGCCGWSDMAKPPEITAPTPLSTLRLTHSPTVSANTRDRCLLPLPAPAPRLEQLLPHPSDQDQLRCHPLRRRSEAAGSGNQTLHTAELGSVP